MVNLYLDFELQIERAAAEGQYLVSSGGFASGDATADPRPFPFCCDVERLQDKLETP